MEDVLRHIAVGRSKRMQEHRPQNVRLELSRLTSCAGSRSCASAAARCMTGSLPDASCLPCMRGAGGVTWIMLIVRHRPFQHHAAARCDRLFWEKLVPVLRTDRMATHRMCKLSKTGIKPTGAGVRPLDSVMARMRDDSSVMFYMLPTLSVPKRPSPMRTWDDAFGGKGKGKQGD